MTTNTDSGSNGPMLPEVLDMHATAPLIKRQGAYRYRCLHRFPRIIPRRGRLHCLSQPGSLWTYSKHIAEEANARMREAGVQNLSMFAIATDLMRDWRSTPGLPELLPFFDKYFPVYGFLARNFNFASNGNQL
ncbi:hypothetical protein PQX77_001356 [Marasmius sp. AFHP31]|nr:hypothetical protein PQX77_001356 [Marasmius sp. AFHP31]